ncbi:helicase-related protein, partial [Candidatus Zixiibacteriota bacterium]
LYRQFASGEGNILLGTQMVAKGFHFPGVTLVGVISADAELHFPDFRANERTFQLIMQVAGRAGRGEESGEVIVQSYAGDNPGILHAVAGDFPGFMSAEISSRMTLGYPPSGRMIRILLKGREESAVLKTGKDVSQKLQAVIPKSVMVLGPAPAPLYRLNRWYRAHLFLRGPSAGTLRTCVERSGIDGLNRKGVHLAVDVDPVDML